jgi:hypothetical protein
MNGSWARSSRASVQLVQPNTRLKLTAPVLNRPVNGSTCES